LSKLDEKLSNVDFFLVEIRQRLITFSLAIRSSPIWLPPNA